MKNQLESFLKEQLKEIMKVRGEFSKETDRGCALMAASFLDFELEKLLRNKLAGSKKHLDALFEVNGPLGTFSSRIRLSYSVGLIPKDAMNDLEIIRKIRNDFGHKYEPISFETKSIKDRLNNLKNHYFSKEEGSPRQRFTNTVLGVLASIHAAEIKKSNFNEAEGVENSEEFKLNLKKMRDQLVKEILDTQKK